MANNNKKMFFAKHPRALLLIFIASFLASLGIALLTFFLAVDMITIPYLTPVAHYIAWAVQPVVPLIAPTTLGVFVKVLRSTSLASLGLRKYWVVIVACQLPQHVERVWKQTSGLYTFGDCTTGTSGSWCAAGKCWVGYVQVAAFVWVIAAEVMGWRWEGGVVDWGIEEFCAGERFLREDKEGDELEEEDDELEKGEFKREKSLVVGGGA